MDQTYSNIYLHFVWAVKFREPVISMEMAKELLKYINVMTSKRGCKLIAGYCMPDHIHLLISYRPSIPIPELVKEIKYQTNLMVNSKKRNLKPFYWQNGYGVFSVSENDKDKIAAYIKNQEKHHKAKNYPTEFLELLRENNLSEYHDSKLDE